MAPAARSSTSLSSLKGANLNQKADPRRDDLAKKRIKALLFDEPDFSMRLDAIEQHALSVSITSSMQHSQSATQATNPNQHSQQSSRSMDLKPVTDDTLQQHHQKLSSLHVVENNEQLITFDPHPITTPNLSNNNKTTVSPVPSMTASASSQSTSPSSSSSNVSSARSVSPVNNIVRQQQQQQLVDKIGDGSLIVTSTAAENKQQPPQASTTTSAPPDTIGGGLQTQSQHSSMSAMDHSIDAMIKSLTERPMLPNSGRLKNNNQSMKDNFELISSSNFIRYQGYRMHRFMNNILGANHDLGHSSSHTFDLKIEVENEVYFVHKFIIESQVPHIIDKMIDISDNSVKKASLITRIELRNVSNEGFKPIYQFIYGGHVEPTKDNFLPTLDAAIRLFMIDFARIWICELALQYKTKSKWVSTLMKITKLYGWKEEEVKMRQLRFKLLQEESGKVEQIVRSAKAKKSPSQANTGAVADKQTTNNTDTNNATLKQLENKTNLL